jgi:PHS family inorganic phosphate transporter-like MFS transporter
VRLLADQTHHLYCSPVPPTSIAAQTSAAHAPQTALQPADADIAGASRTSVSPASPLVIAPQSPLLQASVWRSHARSLCGTCLPWFFFDVAFYSNGLFAGALLAGVLGAKADPNNTELAPAREGAHAASRALAMDLCVRSIVIALLSLPGYGLAVVAIQKVRAKTLQMTGFAALVALYLVLAWLAGPHAATAINTEVANETNTDPHNRTTPTPPNLNSAGVEAGWAYVILYGLTFLVANAGPNTTTFILPTRIFPRKIRCSFHGLSAASGKLGAAVGALYAPHVLGSRHAWGGARGMMTVNALACLLGLFCTAVCIPADLDTISNNSPNSPGHANNHTAHAEANRTLTCP